MILMHCLAIDIAFHGSYMVSMNCTFLASIKYYKSVAIFQRKKAPSCFLLSSFSFSIGSRLLVKGFGVNQSSWRLLKSILEANGWQLLQFLAKNYQKRPLLTSFLEGLNLACVLLVADFELVPLLVRPHKICQISSYSKLKQRVSHRWKLEVYRPPVLLTLLLLCWNYSIKVSCNF